MRSRRSFSSLLLVSLCLIGCTTNMREQFERVQVGMEKNDVLNLMNSPQRTQRWHGMDRWTYIFYTDGVRYEKEVHFSEGIAKYAGDIFKPEISADQQDQLNEEANKQLEAQYQSKREQNTTAFPQYEDQTKGTDAIRYVPQFVPVE